MEPLYLVITGAACMLFSLMLAWIASLIVYGKVAFLKNRFRAPYQLIRAHIDYLLMSLLMFAGYYLCTEFRLEVSPVVLFLACFGALYNPVGFIILAVKPEMANPETRAEKAKILLGFLPATIGFGGIMVYTLGVVV